MNLHDRTSTGGDSSVSFNPADFPALPGDDDHPLPSSAAGNSNSHSALNPTLNGSATITPPLRESSLAASFGNTFQNPTSTLFSLGGGITNAYSYHARQPKSSSFAIQKEDFPALPQLQGDLAADKASSVEGASLLSEVGDIGNYKHGSLGRSIEMKNATASRLSAVSSEALLKGDGLHRSQLSQRLSSSSGSRISRERFGILGLLKVIKEERKQGMLLKGTKNKKKLVLGDNFLDLGTDINLLNLDVNSSEPLFDTFTSPFFNGGLNTKMRKNDPDFEIPDCYLASSKALKVNIGSQGISLKRRHFSKCPLSTLFYAFYNFPKDILQVLAAQELYNRSWKFHLESSMWFIPKTAQNLSERLSAESGGSYDYQYKYFDHRTWKMKYYSNKQPGNEEEIFLSKETMKNQLLSPDAIGSVSSKLGN